MSTAMIDELVTKVKGLSNDEQTEFLRRVTETLNTEAAPNGTVNKGHVETVSKNIDPNIEWIKENKAKYAGNYVALKDGHLIAYGRTIKEADQASKAKGIKTPFLHYIFPKDHIPFAGW